MSSDQRIAQILADCIDRQDRGEQIDVEAVIATNPDLAPALRDHFAALDLIDHALGAASRPEHVPQRLGDFRIIREIGRGGMGVVYEAEQLSMKRRVAIKLLSPAVTATPQALHRFQREARAAGRLHHTNLVPVYGLGEDSGFFYYAMEFVAGRPLSAVVEQTEMSQRRHETRERIWGAHGERETYARIARAMAGVAEALDLVHREGILHRDIKPSNLLLDPNGELRIVDFGLARMEQQDLKATRTGQVIGTPVYMSPEQTLGGSIDHRTDIYSVGATLYELLTLRLPFTGETVHDVCTQVLTTEPALPRQVDPRVPKDLETIVLKAMEKEPARRYPTAAALARDLRRFAEGAPIRARRVGLLGRAYRKIKRHKAVSTATASLALLVGVVVVFVASSSEAARRQRLLDYQRLVARADRVRGDPLDVLDSQGADAGMEARQDAVGLYSDAIARMPDLPDAYAGRALVQGRPLSERLEDLDAARDRGLRPRPFRVFRAYVLGSDGQWRSAWAEQELAAGLERTTAADSVFEARLLVASGRTGAAETLAGEILDELPADNALRPRVLRLRARLRLHGYDIDGALDDLGDLQSQGGAEGSQGAGRALGKEMRDATGVWERVGSATYRNAKLWADRSERLVRVKHFEEARRAFATWAGLPPDSEAVKLCSAGRFKEAEALLARARAEHPGLAAAHYAHGHVLLYGLDRPGEALQAFDAALNVDKEMAVAWYGRALTLDRARHYPRPLAELDHALAADPEFVPAMEWKAVALRLYYRKAPAALAAIDAACAADPDDPTLWIERTLVLSDLDRIDDALRSVEKSIELDDGVRFAHDLRAVLLAGEYIRAEGVARFTGYERYEEALESTLRSVQLNPLHTRAWVRRGNVLRYMGRLAESVACFDRALALDPDDQTAHSCKAASLAGLQRFESALREAVRFDRYNPGGLNHWRSLCLARLGKLDEAASVLAPTRVAGRMLSFVTAYELLGRRKEALARAEDGISEDWRRAPFVVHCLRGLGRHPEATEVSRHYAGRTPGRVDRVSWAYLAAVAGDSQRARKLVESYDLTWTPDTIYDAARVFAVLHDSEATLDWLGRAAKSGFRMAQNVAPDLDFDWLEDDPRYEELLDTFAKN